MDHPGHGSYVSFVLHIDQSGKDDHFDGRVVIADGQQVGLSKGSYLVRAWFDREARFVRGTIRHEASGLSVHFQTGDRVAAFVRACLVEDELSSD